jgi:CRISPR-associated protein Csx3
MKFIIKELETFTIVHFELEKPIKPEELKNLEIPNVNPRKGVVISGRGPIWLHCFLAHKFHPTPFVAIYDPRLGAVVVQSHADLKEGDVLDIVVEEVLR